MLEKLIKLYEQEYNKCPLDFTCWDVGDPVMRLKYHLQELENKVGKDKLEKIIGSK